MLPTIKLGSYDVTRLIIGGNPFSGNSHVDGEMDQDLLRYYTMPRIQQAFDECWQNGINTIQTRGDKHLMRAYLEHQENGGQLQWIVQTASEFASVPNNIAQIARYGAIAVYNHGSQTDNWWHEGKIDDVEDHVKCIKDQGLLAGVGTHIPEVIEYVEEKGWETDFYMSCFYNLARGHKAAPAEEQDAYARDRFAAEDPDRMTAVMRQTPKPCLGFKIMAASRNCGSAEQVKETFQRSFERIKAEDAVVVGVFQKYRNQIAENAGYVREILG